MKMLKSIHFAAGVLMLAFLASCEPDENKGSFIDRITGLTPKNDVALGRQIAAEIAADPRTYPILPEALYPKAYEYLQGMTDDIVENSDEVKFKDLFPYEVTIIQDDETLNAFATPGGFLYVYTGLIKYLDEADDLAGVMGHEIAHSSARHSKKQLEKNLGLQFLLNVLVGGQAQQAAQLLTGLLSLQFSRKDEANADDLSVIYLSETGYACNGAATFFQKIEAAGGSRAPVFLSTHPKAANRVSDINRKANELNCSTKPASSNGMTYAEFKSLLP